MPANAIRTLYDRLKSKGFDRRYVRDAMLPDWWDDALYEDASGRLTAELYVARFLGVPVQQVRDESRPLDPAVGNVRLKRTRNGASDGVQGAVSASLHAARLTASLMEDLLPFTGVRPALEVREQLLKHTNCAWPDLAGLADYCWQHGIGVIHVTRLPSGPSAKKIVGLATFVGSRPVVVLCSARDSSAWLAFHLAHEVGHIMSEHVKPGGAPVVDVQREGASEEQHEREADQYAFQVLTGDPNPRIGGPGLNGPNLAAAARSFGAQHRIDPGTAALIYGYTQRRIPAAQAALQVMGADRGARQLLAESFRKHVNLDDVPEWMEGYLAAATQVYGLSRLSGA